MGIAIPIPKAHSDLGICAWLEKQKAQKKASLFLGCRLEIVQGLASLLEQNIDICPRGRDQLRIFLPAIRPWHLRERQYGPSRQRERTAYICRSELA
jgi:hypothetical protein